jgi:hypothetical protein
MHEAQSAGMSPRSARSATRPNGRRIVAAFRRRAADGSMSARMFLWEIDETAGADSAWVWLEEDRLRAEGRVAALLPHPHWVTYRLETRDRFVTARMEVEAHSADGSATLDLRNAHYDDDDLLDTNGLAEIWEHTWPLEDAILQKTERQLARWRKSGADPQSVKAFHQTMAERAMKLLSELNSYLLLTSPPATSGGRGSPT